MKKQLFKIQIIIHNDEKIKYIESMRKFVFAALLCSAAVAAATFAGGCKKSVNYGDYVSEKRYDTYAYGDDNVDIKINLYMREAPFCADGIKGKVEFTGEICVTLPQTYELVEVEFCGNYGEMNYSAVENNYTLDFCEWNADGKCDVTITADGTKNVYQTESVLYEGVIGCERALDCVTEKNADYFKRLCDGDVFLGEIFIRLLYDEGCYYYVGVCDRQGAVKAFLVDGEQGKIIATHDGRG